MLHWMKHQLDFEKPIVELQHKLEELKKHPETHSLDISFEQEVAQIESKIEETRRQIFSNLSAWDRIKIARHPKRPFALDYIRSSFTDFSELHGDRLFFRPDISPVGADRANVMRCCRSLMSVGGCCCCCHRCCQRLVLFPISEVFPAP